MTDRRARSSSAPWLAALAALVAAAVLLPGLGAHGLWTDAELPALARAEAALGEARSGLVRSPWLPDLLRTRGYALVGGAAGLRLPHALAAVALVAMTVGLGRMRGASVGASLLAGAFALAFPMLAVVGRTAVGNPVGEALGVAAVLAGLVALRAAGRARALLFAVVAAGLVALAVSSAGLALGGVVPLAGLAVATSLDRPASGASPRGRAILAAAPWVALLGAVAVTVVLSLQQGDGYIPLLGASKDLELVDKPEARRFAAGLEDLGYGLFPWAPLVVAGALLGRDDRLPALWLGLAIAVACGHGLVYGTVPLPVTVPAALCAATAVAWLQDPRTDRTARRLVLTVVVLGVLVVRKDAERTPSRVAVPVVPFEGEHTFPAKRLETPERLKRIGGVAILALLGAGLVGRPRRRPEGAELEGAAASDRTHDAHEGTAADEQPSRAAAATDHASTNERPSAFERLLDPIPARPRAAAPLVLLGAAALFGAHGYAQRLVPEICDLLSPRRLLEHHRALVEAGELPAALGNHHVRDPGLSLYGPGDVIALASRHDVTAYLAADEPRAAVVLARDLPGLHQDHRANGWPLYVLDDRHAHLRLVANRLPPGERDHSPIHAVLFDEPVALRHPTMLRFDEYIEIIGWEVTEPVVRGREATLSLSIRVLRPLPGGTQIYARLLKGRTSRINGEPHDLTGGVYPPNFWRAGDYILHQLTFEAPLLEIQPGAHELLVGLRRTERENIEISVPEGKTGEHGVEVRGKTRHFAALGTVEVW